MIIQNLSSYGNSKSPEILAHAQTISNHFIDALEQNDCNLKVVIGFYFEVEDSINTAVDLVEALTIEPWKPPPFITPPRTRIDTPANIVKTPEGIEEAVKALKNKCFNCKLSLPKIKFEKDFRFIYNKLTFQLEIFKFTLPSLQKPNWANYCHMSFAFQKACIPDILKFIAFLLMGLSAILALNKLPKISLGVFVKAIIGKIMASVVANIKLSVDMSQTGLPCILSAIEEIANAIPTKEDIYNLEMSDELRDMMFPKEPYTTLSGKVKQPFVPRTVFIQTQNQLLSSKQITREEYDKNILEYSKKNEPLRHYARQLREQTNMYEERAQNKIDETFGKISDIVTRVQDEVNAYIQSLLGVLDFFECESTRSGPDFSELVEYIAKIQEVINFISSLLGMWLVKILKPLICLDTITHKDIAKVLDETPVPPLSNADLADIIQEFTGKETILDEDGVTVLIYDKPAKQLLPKLSLMGCNLKEFAEAHTIDNIIPAVVDYITDNEDSNTKPRVPRTPGVTIIKDIGNIRVIPTRGTPVIVPPTNYYKPIPVPIPKAIRDIPVKIPPTLIARVLPRPTGTNIVVKPTPQDTTDKLPPFVQKPNQPGTPPVKITPPLVYPPITNIPPTKIPPVVGIIDKIKEDKDVIDRISLPPVGVGDTDVTIPDEIDDLLDFIYNPPTKPDNPSTEYVDIDKLEDVFQTSNTNIRTKDKESSNYSNTFQKECKTFEDVLDILNTLKI